MSQTDKKCTRKKKKEESSSFHCLRSSSISLLQKKRPSNVWTRARRSRGVYMHPKTNINRPLRAYFRKEREIKTDAFHPASEFRPSFNLLLSSSSFPPLLPFCFHECSLSSSSSSSLELSIYLSVLKKSIRARRKRN